MDDYTPYGYLDNPWHCARLNPSGVVRCRPAIGFAWHYPGYPGPYTREQLYRTGLRLAVRHHTSLLLTPEDFAKAAIALVSRSHSKNIMSFDWRQDGLDCRAAYFLHDEHALCCLLSLENGTAADITAEWVFIAEYERNVGAGASWDDGLLARWRPGRRALALLAYPEGEAFVCAAGHAPADHAVSTSLGELLASLASSGGERDLASTPPAAGPASVSAALVHRALARPGERVECLAALGRGATERHALASVRRALGAGQVQYARHRAVDEEFRRQCPQLSGDWPAHWRRGLRYDAETLRAAVRPPRGIYRRPWDGMQIQAPRTVLAEAALDALLLSYAAPGTARQLVLGVFAAARAANVPCSREDGSYNMLAEDGEPCGTAPEWCFPLFCIDLLHRRCGDLAWLRTLYPYLARYLSWWLRHRRDEQGWLHYHCSWESGQDESPRFGRQASGGTLIEHIRPVDLHASVAQGAAILARFAAELGRSHDVLRWQRVAADCRAKTQALWRGDWFCDYDLRRQAAVPFRDVMHLSPLLAGVATAEQVAILRPAFTALPPHGTWPPLDWPPVVFTAVEAASAAGWHDLTSSLAARLAEHVYRAYDVRPPLAGGPLPGIASERWATEGSWGCEGYGWGALGTLLVIRHVIGWQETADGHVALQPGLPPDWSVPGRRFTIAPLHHRGADLQLSYSCAADGALEISLAWTGSTGVARVVGGTRQVVSSRGKAADHLLWQGRNGGSYRIEFESS